MYRGEYDPDFVFVRTCGNRVFVVQGQTQGFLPQRGVAKATDFSC